MSDESDADGDGNGAGEEERNRKRIRQACLNCRRKKVRCGGEKPVCHFCSRLSQQCVYTEDGRSQRQASSSVSFHLSGDESSSVLMDTMNSRFAALEDKLARVEGTLSRFESLLSNVAAVTQNQALSPGPSPVNRPVVAAAGRLSTPTVISPALSHFDKPPIHTLMFAADVYFRFCYNQPYSLFHEASFRQRLISGELPDHQLWALIATARRFSTLPDLQFSTTDDAMFYAKRAWESMHLPWGGTARDEEVVQVVQTLILIVGIEHPAGLCSSAYMKLGVAIRIAQLYKMYMEPDATLPVVVQEERRRTFWSLYLQDKLISLARDRFPNLRNEECSVCLPCSEASYREGVVDDTAPNLESFMGDCFNAVATKNCSPLALITVMATVLSRVSQYVLQQKRYVQLGPPWSTTNPYNAILATLLQLEMHFGLSDPCKDSLQRLCFVNGAIDQHLAGSFIYAKALFHLSHCLLHHPFLLQERLQSLGQSAPSSFMRTAWETCRAHARSLTDLKDMRNHNVITLTSFYGYGIMVAGTIHVFAMKDDIATVREEGEKHYKAAMDFLNDLSCYWKHAALMANRLERFSKQYKDRPQLLTPSEQDAKALWQSVDYALLSTPTRPTSPTTSEPSPDQASFHMSFNQLFDFTDLCILGDADVQCDNFTLGSL